MSRDLLLPEFLVEQCRRLFRPERSRLLLLWLAHEGRYSAAVQHCQVDYYNDKCLNEKKQMQSFLVELDIGFSVSSLNLLTR